MLPNHYNQEANKYSHAFKILPQTSEMQGNSLLLDLKKMQIIVIHHYMHHYSPLNGVPEWGLPYYFVLQMFSQTDPLGNEKGWGGSVDDTATNTTVTHTSIPCWPYLNQTTVTNIQDFHDDLCQVILSLSFLAVMIILFLWITFDPSVDPSKGALPQIFTLSRKMKCW